MTEPDFEHKTSDSVSVFLVIYFICVSTLYVSFRISSNRIWMGKQLCFEDVPLPICQFEQFYLLYCFLFGEVSQLHTHCFCRVTDCQQFYCQFVNRGGKFLSSALKNCPNESSYAFSNQDLVQCFWLPLPIKVEIKK